MSGKLSNLETVHFKIQQMFHTLTSDLVTSLCWTKVNAFLSCVDAAAVEMEMVFLPFGTLDTIAKDKRTDFHRQLKNLLYFMLFTS